MNLRLQRQPDLSYAAVDGYKRLVYQRSNRI
jgi:hypothetical protein